MNPRFSVLNIISKYKAVGESTTETKVESRHNIKAMIEFATK